MTVELIGVPFDSYGRPGHLARAAAALRDAGLAQALPSVITGDDLTLPAPDPRRGPHGGLLNEPALEAMAAQLHDRVRSSVQAGHFPLVYGGDCAALLGILPALTGTGLLLLDGHEDTMPLDVSEDGEAANTEIGLLLGLTGRTLTGPLAARLPALAADHLTVLGCRDQAWRRRFNVGSLREQGVWLRDRAEVAADPAGAARAAVSHLSRVADGWWLHVDLDVLDPREFPAQGEPGVPDDPGGLTWDELTTLVAAAVRYGGCTGASLAVYDPDQDPTGAHARRIVRAVHDLTG